MCSAQCTLLIDKIGGFSKTRLQVLTVFVLLNSVLTILPGVQKRTGRLIVTGVFPKCRHNVLYWLIRQGAFPKLDYKC